MCTFWGWAPFSSNKTKMCLSGFSGNLFNASSVWKKHFFFSFFFFSTKIWFRNSAILFISDIHLLTWRSFLAHKDCGKYCMPKKHHHSCQQELFSVKEKWTPPSTFGVKGWMVKLSLFDNDGVILTRPSMESLCCSVLNSCEIEFTLFLLPEHHWPLLASWQRLWTSQLRHKSLAIADKLKLWSLYRFVLSLLRC